MTTRELIKKLQSMPPGAPVLHVWDGEPRTEIEHVWLSRNGDVMTAADNEVVYSTDARPTSAPTKEEDSYWCTPRSAEPVDA
jgi:hypothetical protein